MRADKIMRSNVCTLGSRACRKARSFERCSSIMRQACSLTTLLPSLEELRPIYAASYAAYPSPPVQVTSTLFYLLLEGISFQRASLPLHTNSDGYFSHQIAQAQWCRRYLKFISSIITSSYKPPFLAIGRHGKL